MGRGGDLYRSGESGVCVNILWSFRLTLNDPRKITLKQKILPPIIHENAAQQCIRSNINFFRKLKFADTKTSINRRLAIFVFKKSENKNPPQCKNPRVVERKPKRSLRFAHALTRSRSHALTVSRSRNISISF